MRQGWRRIWWYPPVPVGGRVYEIGYGRGAFQRAGRERGWVMEGCDPGHAAPHAGCRQEAVEEVRWVRHGYDAMVAWQVLEHLEDPEGVLRRVREALKPGGWLVASMPNTRCVERWLWGEKWDGWRQPPEVEGWEVHRSHWDARGFRALLERCGFPAPGITVRYQRVAKQLPGGIVTGAALAAVGLASRMTVAARLSLV